MLEKNKFVKLLTYPLGFSQFVIGLLVAALGFGVILVWHMGRLELLRSLPTSIVMAYNTAVSFFVCGIIILANLLKARRFGLFLQLFIVLFGAAILVEDFAGTDLGIDQLLMSYPAEHNNDYPGRVPLNSAVSFILTGLAYFFLSTRLPYKEFISSSFGAAVLGFGTVALTGYFFDIPMAYSWGSFSQMATLTAIGTIILGTGLIVSTWRQENPYRLKLPHWTPVIVFLGMSVITIDLYYALTAQQTKTIRQTLNSRIFEVQNHIKGAMDYRVSFMRELKDRWEKHGYNNRTELEKDAASSLRMYSDFRAVAYFDRNAQPVWAVPNTALEISSTETGGKKVIPGYWTDNFPSAPDFTVSDVFTTEHGRKSMIIYLPILADGKLDGFVAVNLDLEAFLQEALSFEFKSDFSILISGRNAELYSLGDHARRDVYVEKELELFGGWLVRIYPSSRLDDGLSTSIHRLQFGVGMVVSTLMGLVFYFLQNSKRAIRKNNLTNRRLSREIEVRKKLENRLRLAKDVADKSSKLKAAFLANMSHEIRTPMNSVIGASELLLDTRLTPEQIQYVHLIQNNGEMLLKIINDILDLSKIEEDKLVFEEIEFDLRDTLTVVSELFSYPVGQKGLNFETIFADGVPGRLRGDPRRLQQVLINLLSNALKFTDRGGIIVRVDCLSENEREAEMGFSVKDTGIGIDKDVREKIFMPFTQADGSTTRKYGGTGLGLAICQKLVKLMRGNIGLRSEVGTGTTFWFTAKFGIVSAGRENEANPAMDSALRRPPNVEVSRRPARTAPLILLVEDNPTNQMVLKKQIEQIGLLVDIAGDGQKALDIARQQTYDLVLMDCQMPVMDGYAATRAIRSFEANSGRRTPIIALTANAMSDDLQKCLAAGMDGYLSKPIRRAMLEKTFAQWLPTLLAESAVEPVKAERSMTGTPPEAAANSEIVNVEERLKILADECGQDAIVELVAIFFEDTLSKIIHLQQLLYHPEKFQEIIRGAHTLKGACLNFGANEMADLCVKLEKAASDGEVETVFYLLEQLKLVLDRLFTGIERKIPTKSKSLARLFKGESF